jgi:hypothetical protein
VGYLNRKQGGIKGLQKIAHQVMSEWSIWIDALLGECNRCRFGCSNPDREKACSINLLQ